MIGGIADWFGITALLRKPLGIPFRTEIIPRNREKLFSALVSMVENELLSKDVLRQKLEGYDAAGAVIRYMDEYGGKEDISQILARFIAGLASETDPSSVNKILRDLLSDKKYKPAVSNLIARILECTIDNGYENHLLDYTILETSKLAGSAQFYAALEDMTAGLVKRLEIRTMQESVGKRIVFKLFFSLLGTSDSLSARLTSKLYDELMDRLDDLGRPDSRNRAKLLEWIRCQISDAGKASNIKRTIENIVTELIEHLNLEPSIKKLVEALHLEMLNGTGSYSGLDIWLGKIIDKGMAVIKENSAGRNKFNSFMKELLMQLIDEKHHEIGIIVERKLDSFTDEMLVELIESRCGNDLQIIRINGSMVGGLTGLLIFLATCWI